MRDRKVRLFDVAIFLMVVVSIAFYDMKILFLSSQVLAILFAIPIVIKKNIIVRKSAVAIYIVWAILFIFYSFLSMLWASGENETIIPTTLSIMQVVLLSLTVIVYCGSEKGAIDKTLNYIVCASIILAARFIMTIPMSSWGNGERFSKDTIFGSNVPAIASAYAALVLFWKIISNRKMSKKKKVTYSCLILIFVVIGLLMGTKKSILIFVIGSIVILLMNSKNMLKALRNLALASILAIGGYIVIQNTPLFHNSIGYRINDFIREISDDDSSGASSTVMRRKFFEQAMEVYSENPVLGIGQDGFRYVNKYERTYSHSNFSELLANLGSIGFMIYYSIYVFTLISVERNKNRGLIMALTFAMFFADTAVISYSMEINYILFGTIFGMLSDDNFREEKNK